MRTLVFHAFLVISMRPTLRPIIEVKDPNFLVWKNGTLAQFTYPLHKLRNDPSPIYRSFFVFPFSSSFPIRLRISEIALRLPDGLPDSPFF